jgi:hypothetical protein
VGLPAAAAVASADGGAQNRKVRRSLSKVFAVHDEPGIAVGGFQLPASVDVEVERALRIGARGHADHAGVTEDDFPGVQGHDHDAWRAGIYMTQLSA